MMATCHLTMEVGTWVLIPNESLDYDVPWERHGPLSLMEGTAGAAEAFSKCPGSQVGWFPRTVSGLIHMSCPLVAHVGPTCLCFSSKLELKPKTKARMIRGSGEQLGA